jgi:hypothetical protein
MVAVIYEQIDCAVKSTKILNRIADQQIRDAGVRLSQQPPCLRVDVGSKVSPIEAFGAVLEQGSAQQHGAVPLIHARLDHYLRF